MNLKALFLCSILFCTYAQADEYCEMRDGGLSPSSVISDGKQATSSGQCPVGTYSKNTADCPQPKSYCSSAKNPINSYLQCRGIGGGSLICEANPTSIDGALVYHWTVHKSPSYQLIHDAYGGANLEVFCAEDTLYNVQLTISDIFGQSETVNVSEVCLVGSEN